jgi:hypothetical protein
MLLPEDFVINSNYLFKIEAYLFKIEAKGSLSIPCPLSCLWFVLVKGAVNLLRRLKKKMKMDLLVK